MPAENCGVADLSQSGGATAGASGRSPKDRQAERALNAAGFAWWEFDVGAKRIAADAALWDLLGMSATPESRGPRDVLAAVAQEDRALLWATLRSALDAGGSFTCVFRLREPQGPERWLKLTGRRCGVDDGAAGLLGLCSDVTDEERRRAATELTLNELDHRVKNVFAVTLGLITMTARAAATPGDMAETLAGRLSALARAHGLLRSPGGSRQATMSSVMLAQIVDAVIEPLLPPGRRRVGADGPHVVLGPKAVTSLAMLLQELSTNALKHGALAKEGGEIAVRWQVNGDRLRLAWAEHGVAPAPILSREAGFGWKLIDTLIRNQLQGGIVRTASDHGLALEFDLPLQSLKD